MSKSELLEQLLVYVFDGRLVGEIWGLGAELQLSSGMTYSRNPLRIVPFVFCSFCYRYVGLKNKTHPALTPYRSA